jgi:Zn-dependent metalloprotease
MKPVLALAAAAAMLSFNTSAQTAPTASQLKYFQDRALVLVVMFPGYTLADKEQTFTAGDTVVDPDGTQHVRIHRQVRGLRVIGGDMVVHVDAKGTLIGVSKTMNLSINAAATAGFSAGTAISTALGAYPGSTKGTVPELIIHARGDIPTLAYDVIVSRMGAEGLPSRMHVIVDASTNRILEAWDDIQAVAATGTGKALFVGTLPIPTDLTGSTYSLKDPTRGNQQVVNLNNTTPTSTTTVGGTLYTSTTNTWGTNANGTTTAGRQTVGVDALFAMTKTWDYFLTTHGRNGIANDGVGAAARVHYGTSFNNAFWMDSCFCMSFGDGNGTSYNPFVSLDITAHEMTHGITARTANLTYSGESGGLNEATSDIFGTAVEYYAANTADAGDFLIGEKIKRTGNMYFRSMIKPSADGYSADCWYSTVGNLLVHQSSGVANHFFYLLSQGTKAGVPSKTCLSSNTRVATGTGTLTGITRAKAEKIWYRALTVYMTSSTNYAAARVATINAATDLYGASSTETNSVKAAWTAVLVNNSTTGDD